MGCWFTYVASVSMIASSGAWLVQLSSRTEVTTKDVGNSTFDSKGQGTCLLEDVSHPTEMIKTCETASTFTLICLDSYFHQMDMIFHSDVYKEYVSLVDM